MLRQGPAPNGKIGAAFGSYGWGGEAVKLLNAALEEMKIDLVDQGVKAIYVPTTDDLDHCRELGRAVGRAVLGDNA